MKVVAEEDSAPEHGEHEENENDASDSVFSVAIAAHFCTPVGIRLQR